MLFPNPGCQKLQGGQVPQPQGTRTLHLTCQGHPSSGRFRVVWGCSGPGNINTCRVRDSGNKCSLPHSLTTFSREKYRSRGDCQPSHSNLPNLTQTWATVPDSDLAPSHLPSQQHSGGLGFHVAKQRCPHQDQGPEGLGPWQMRYPRGA